MTKNRHSILIVHVVRDSQRQWLQVSPPLWFRPSSPGFPLLNVLKDSYPTNVVQIIVRPNTKKPAILPNHNNGRYMYKNDSTFWNAC